MTLPVALQEKVVPLGQLPAEPPNSTVKLPLTTLETTPEPDHVVPLVPGNPHTYPFKVPGVFAIRKSKLKADPAVAPVAIMREATVMSSGTKDTPV